MGKRQALTFVDLFAGAGGFSLGFVRAGFSCVGVIENDSRTSQTYQSNFPGHAALQLSRLGPTEGDILSLTKREVRIALRMTGVSEVDVLLAGPPCQGFSKIGRGKLDHLANQEGAAKSDPRNRMYRKFLAMLDWIRPRAFLFENVPGILTIGGTNVAEAICEGAAAAGYHVACTALNAAWYGVPQSRERVFILGIRSDLKVIPSFPQPAYRAELTTGHLSESDQTGVRFHNRAFFLKTENPRTGPSAICVEAALGDLPPFLDHLRDPEYKADRSRIRPQSYLQGRPTAYASLMRRWDETLVSNQVLDHYCRSTPRDFETFGLMRPGDKYPRAVELAEQRFEKAKRLYRKGILSSRPRRKDFVPPYKLGAFEEKWWKLVPSLPSWTITAHLAKDCYSHIHYDTQKRAITVREAARLQSFPDAFKFSGHTGDCFRQIGNAVPPLLSHAVAKHLHKLLTKKFIKEGKRIEGGRISVP
jgi:DNA (cytosine-5)-methyltransferase 1